MLFLHFPDDFVLATARQTQLHAVRGDEFTAIVVDLFTECTV